MSELTGGIENALDRGESPEKAKQSFLNAGYKKEDIEEAFNESSQYEATAKPQNIVQSANITSANTAPQADNTNLNLPPSPPQNNLIPKKKKNNKVLIIVLIILVLLLIGSGVAFLVFKDQIYNFLGGYL